MAYYFLFNVFSHIHVHHVIYNNQVMHLSEVLVQKIKVQVDKHSPQTEYSTTRLISHIFSAINTEGTAFNVLKFIFVNLCIVVGVLAWLIFTVDRDIFTVW